MQGTTSITEQCWQLHQAGQTNQEIARQLSKRPKDVAALICNRRQRPERPDIEARMMRALMPRTRAPLALSVPALAARGRASRTETARLCTEWIAEGLLDVVDVRADGVAVLALREAA